MNCGVWRGGIVTRIIITHHQTSVTTPNTGQTSVNTSQLLKLTSTSKTRKYFMSRIVVIRVEKTKLSFTMKCLSLD